MDFDDIEDPLLRFWLGIAAIGLLCSVVALLVLFVGAFLPCCFNPIEIFQGGADEQWLNNLEAFSANIAACGFLLVVGLFGFVKRWVRVKCGFWIHGAIFLVIPLVGLLLYLFGVPKTSSMGWIFRNSNIILLYLGFVAFCVAILLVAGATGPFVILIVPIVIVFYFRPYCEIMGWEWFSGLREPASIITKLSSAREHVANFLMSILGLSVVLPRKKP